VGLVDSAVAVDPHRNIFFYYRGPVEDTERRAVWDRQLENNTTKALINLLELASPAAGLIPFLKLVGLPPSIVDDASSFLTCLQRVPEAVRQATRKYAVLISPSSAPSQAAGGTGGRPDAFVYSPARAAAILIESKVVTHASRKQLSGHLRAIGWPSNTSWTNTTWEAIFECFQAAALTQATRPLDTFLLRQFLQYLEFTGMAPFNGFSEEDFDFFVTPDKEYASILKAKMDRFGRLVYARLSRALQQSYSEGAHVGRIATKRQGRGIWLAIRKPQHARDPLRHCNFTLELESEGLFMNAVIRDGRHDQSRSPVGVLYGLLTKDSETLRQALNLGPQFFVRVYDRQGLGGHRIMPGSEEWHLRGVLRLDHPMVDVVAFLRRMLEVVNYPGVHVGREIPRWDSILGQPALLVESAAASLESLQPVLVAIGETGKP